MGYAVEAVLMVGVDFDALSYEYLNLDHPRVKEALVEFPSLKDEDYQFDEWYELFDFLTFEVNDFYRVSAGRYDQVDYVGFRLAESQVVTNSLLSGQFQKDAEKLISFINPMFNGKQAQVLVYPNVI